MFVENIGIEVKSLEPKDIAKSMHKFWEYQVFQARVKMGAALSSIENGRQSNERHEEQVREDNPFGFGVGSKPYSDQDLKVDQVRYEREKANYEQIVAHRDFVINFFIEKAIENETKNF